MQRFPAFDPPEYVHWKPDAGLVAGFAATLAAQPDRAAIVAALDQQALLDLYRGLLRARLHDVTLKRWVRTGVISKAWLGTGEEAATVGPVHALDREHDVVAPMIRNAAACCEMGMPLAAMLRAYLATADSPSAGRDLHVGDMARGVLQPISHVGDMIPVIAGVALAFKMRGERRVALTWVGDGSVNTAAAHEGTNFAAVQRLPAILIRTIRSRWGPGSTSITFRPISLIGPRATASQAPRSMATTCWTPMRPRGWRPTAAVAAAGPRCSWPRRSAWAGTPRTTNARPARHSPPSCSHVGAGATRSGCTKNT